MDKIKNIGLAVLSFLLLIATAGMYRTKAKAEAEARQRAETDAHVAKALAEEMAAGEAKEQRAQHDPISIDQFTHDPRN